MAQHARDLREPDDPLYDLDMAYDRIKDEEIGALTDAQALQEEACEKFRVTLDDFAIAVRAVSERQITDLLTKVRDLTQENARLRAQLSEVQNDKERTPQTDRTAEPGGSDDRGR